VLEGGLVLFPLLLVLFLILLQSLSAVPRSFEILFYLVGSIGGFLIGAEFPLAVKIHPQTKMALGRSVGLLNASDLAGGWFGGLVGGIVFIPVLGLKTSCFFLASLKLSALLFFLLHSKGLPAPRVEEQG
jgi:predicted membrane-bound spermidine synthase